MKEVNKEHIDELFREGLNLEKDPVVFLESDWDKLEQRLNRHAKKKRVIFWLKPLSGIAALLLLAFSIWLLWPEKQDISTQQAESQPQKQEIQEEQKPPLISSEEITEEMKRDSNTVSSPSSSRVLNRATGGRAQKETPGESVAEKTAAGTGNSSTAGTKENEKQPENPVIPEKQNSQEMSPAELGDQPLTSTEEPVQQPVKPAEKPDFIPVIPLTEEPGEPAKPVRRNRLLALSVLAAPAYNGVDNLNNGQVGADFGLLVTVGLTERWSFSTGALYAKKLYEMDYTSDYNPGYGSSAHDPQTVDADCRVLDIPLNLSYTVINKGKTTVNIGSGISSYIMLREDYRYNYAYTNGEELEDLRLVNENQHWLSVLNFQANFQRRLSKNLSISLQPYLKVPLNDIGYAKVRLQSLGTAVSVNWSF